MGKLIKQSTLSGILIGIGVIMNNMSYNKYFGAILFSFALLTILKCNLKLYTGKIGYYKPSKTILLLVILLFNFIGSLLPTACMFISNNEFQQMFISISKMKFSYGFAELFLYGILCGVLMFVAVHTRENIITIFCIMIFILSGYEHCIADFPYLALNFSFINFCKFIVIIFGNSIGSIMTNILIDDN